ncbi:antibiotic biosynthesis monooxygenase [Streptomyces sp. CRN 30]|uniref:antibiotic biosynthesis monooxygenase n=1 Tax=Streptomyces sp. CRN 30 TaxID=3075613 RepID=UPI002A81C387|nr:antibiotic biosynthesis monooxygenase [Streptomyces sp. CRN 30]
MTRRTDTRPDLARPDVAAPFFSTWRVGGPERQRAAVGAIARAWERRPWPANALRSYHVYTGLDGETLLHHSQWADEAAYEAFAKTHRQERVDEIDTAVPGIERLGLGRYRRYRGGLRDDGTRRYRDTPRDDGTAPAAGRVVIVDVEFEAPDPARQRAWADAALDAPGAGPGAHFHLSTDGTRVLVHAEDTGAEVWRRLRSRPWPGLRSGTVRRYDHALGLVPD